MITQKDFTRTFCQECKLFTYPHEHPSAEVQKIQKNTIYGKLVGDEISHVVTTRETVRPLRVRKSWLTFFADVSAGCTTNVWSQPQLPFRMKRLVVDPVIAPYFRLIDIQVAKNQQSAGYQPEGVGCPVFPADRPDQYPIDNLDGTDTVHVTMTVGLTIKNVDQCSHHEFSAIIYGEIVSE